MATMRQEIEARRTFAIISHPDAGKTTLTEKLLLYGGAIQQAGSVKGKQNARHAVSDWMEIEKQRGISVTSSVLQFNYGGKCVNILDTPGHQDFSEDTYRTLMAADSAVMVIDAAKGVEAQTRKLFKVCTLRHIPIFTFINKMDREARDPFELCEEIENLLGIQTYPMNWPIGCGRDFKGVFDRASRHILAFQSEGKANGVRMVEKIETELGDPSLDELITAPLHRQLADDVELLDGAGMDFDLEAVQTGKLSPVFFGSALTNFGVEPFLRDFLRLTPTPLPRRDILTGEDVDPCREQFSGFIFKIQANMNKAHRDRIAFMRICSGKFERGMDVYHVQQGKNVKLAQSTQLMAQDRATVDTAYAGDIIGLFDPGIFSIGDTLKGMEQIAQEGAIQIFRDLGGGMEEVIVGVVGVLQFEVLEYRLNTEYKVDIRMQELPYEHIRWIENDPDELNPKDLDLTSDTRCIEDLKGNHLLLFASEWSINWAQQHNEALRLSEFGNL